MTCMAVWMILMQTFPNTNDSGQMGLNIADILFNSIYQALTTPLARFPGIARNDRRATIFVSWSCPPNLYFENSGNKRFPVSANCSLHILCALDFEGRFAKWLSLSAESSFVHGLNDLISTVFSLTIWPVKYWTLIWIINDKMLIRLQYIEWLSIDIVQDSGITGPVEMDLVCDCRISTV